MKDFRTLRLSDLAVPRLMQMNLVQVKSHLSRVMVGEQQLREVGSKASMHPAC